MLVFDFSGLGVEVRGLTLELAHRLQVEWASFPGQAGGDRLLDVGVVAREPRADPGPFTAKDAQLTFDGSTATCRMREGRSDAGLDGPVRIELAATSADKQYYALQNLILAALAWRLPSRGGAVIHAAGIVLDGRAFLLVGPEGAGKTTWSLLARSAGADVISDDVVLVDREAARFVALGSPFRTSEHGTLGRGRWPVAAFLVPRHADAASLAPVAPLHVHARIAANLPYAGELYGREPRIDRVVGDLAGTVPSFELSFARDASFVGKLHGLPAVPREPGSVQ